MSPAALNRRVPAPCDFHGPMVVEASATIHKSARTACGGGAVGRRRGHAGRTDANHTQVVEALRKRGASVQSIAGVGSGCPDLLVGYAGANLLLEVKDGAKSPAARRLTDDERRWVEGWRGSVRVVETIEEAIAVVFGAGEA